MARGIKIKVRGLNKMVRKFATTKDALRDASHNAAEAALDLVREGFEKQKAPNGRKWAKLKLRSGRILQDKGRLKASWHIARVNKSRFIVEAGADYAVYHQEGTGIYGPKKSPIKPKRAKALRIPAPGGAIFRASVKGTPKRQMVPEGRLPKRWNDEITEAALLSLKDHFDD